MKPTTERVDLDEVSLLARSLAAGVDMSRVPRVVLAEGDDPRAQQAARGIAALGIRPVLLLTDRTTVPRLRASVGEGCETVVVDDVAGGEAGMVLAEVAERRTWSAAQLAQRLADPVYVAAAMVGAGTADAAVAGSSRPSGEVIRAGLHVIGLEPGCGTLSSSFLLRTVAGDSLCFGDCAVVPEPDSGQLADIAAATATTFATLTGETPRVAMLSFSTHGSADHPAVRVVREATEILRERSPGLAVDGDLQFDAAMVESVAAQKAPGSEVAGRANTFVFPNLAAGNIGYKIAQRMGGATAAGPILQGLRAPLNDLSRGCTPSDIVEVAVIGVRQAQHQELGAALS